MSHHPKQGFVHVYTGDGKGKTTAALGMALRAAGWGLRTYMAQFLKGQKYGELAAVRDHPLITIEQFGRPDCHRRDDVTADDITLAERGLARVREVFGAKQHALVILDEVNVALWFGLLAVDDVLALLQEKPPATDVVLTGRNAPQALLDLADLVTEMREVKHYYQKGVLARKGIEF
jgi:cob(I)alamin adenosyltransferase